jgi:hypothetical protein
MGAFKSVDMSKNFYFSYTYDITSTLQHNLTQTRHVGPGVPMPYNDRFAWNHHMLLPLANKQRDDDDGTNLNEKQGPALNHPNHRPSQWILPLMHGHVDQAST